MDELNDADAYEALTVDLIERLTDMWGGATSRLERQVLMRGRATSKVVDVLWEGLIDGAPFRMIFECKKHKRALNQDFLHGFRSVLDDLDDGTLPTLGVLVALNGYQLGARRIADTYGIAVLEMRPPTAGDVRGLLTQIRFTALVRAPYVEDVAFDWCTSGDAAGHSEGYYSGTLADFTVQSCEDAPVGLADLLLENELSTLDAPPTADRVVRREFAQPVSVLLRGERLGDVRAISGRVGELEHESLMSVGPGYKGVEYLLKNSLNGVSVWFTRDRTYRPA